MSSVADWIGYGVVILPMMVVISTIYCLSELRVNEPKLFETLGKPHIWFTNSKGLGFLFGFVLFGEYREQVRNQHVRQICIITQILTIVWLSMTTLFLLVAAGTVF